MHSSGRVEKAIASCRAGSIYEKDGAWWLRTTDFGDDKDRVVIKSDGAPAYIAADIAYYLDKRARGFDLCIYMLGADHHGYIARLKGIAKALGEDPATVEVLIGQTAKLVRDGQPVRMSERPGAVISDNRVEAIGVDAARYSLIRSSVDTPIDIDLALWSSASNENPVYYVQYAVPGCRRWPATPPSWASPRAPSTSSFSHTRRKARSSATSGSFPVC